MTDDDLLENFRRMNEVAVKEDEGGILIPTALLVKDEGLIVMALAVPPEDIYAQMVVALVKERPAKLIFGLDRWTNDTQGTTSKDGLLTVHFWDGQVWRLGIMEYSYDPPTMQPACWDNAFWSKQLVAEMNHNLHGLRLKPHVEPHPALSVPIKLAD